MNVPGDSPTNSAFPAPIYRDTVLKHVFADAQHFFLPALVDIDLAHVLMLEHQGILSAACATACLQAIHALDLEPLSTCDYDGSVEDLFFLIERKLALTAGEENAGRIHTARSRNDVDLTMYRMVLRERLLQTMQANLALRTTLLTIAAQHIGSVMPAYTHNQPAQPTTLGHFLMGYIEVLERDMQRLQASYARVNQSPLGACAITTTGFPIDRAMTSELLGFRGLVTNSYGAIASVDYVAEACSVLATAMLSLGRFTQEMLLWSTHEFGYLRLSDGYVQISSIMPQKRNPVPLEHTRILASRAMAEAQSVLNALHNTPFADMNDGEDSLQPLVALAFADAERALLLLAGALSEAEFDTKRMWARSERGFLTVTELADTLVRELNISFHHAHAIVSAAVHEARAAGNDDLLTLAEDVRRRLRAESLSISEADLVAALDPAHFIAVRRIPGGPALEALLPEIERALRQQNDHERWLSAEQEHLRHKREALHAAVAARAAMQ